MESGQTVVFFNKTGKYIGEITQTTPEQYLVRTLAVLKHPKQGDLHNPNQTDVPFFHERKALAFREQTNIPIKMIKPFDEEVVPDYKESLKSAFIALKNELEAQNTDYSKKSLVCLNSIKREYELMYSFNWEQHS